MAAAGRRFGNATGNAADDTAGNTAFDTADVAFETRFDAGLRLDLRRRFDRRRGGIDFDLGLAARHSVAGGGGGGGGGGGAAATNAIIDGGVGNTSAAIRGTMTIAATITASRNMVSGTVYHALLPILIEGSTTSPNMSRGTRTPPGRL